MVEPTPPNAGVQLIVSLALPAGAALMFAVMVLVMPIDPMAPDVTMLFLCGAAFAGVAGPGVGSLLRARIPPTNNFAVYLRHALLPAILSLVIREVGILLAAFYIAFGGAVWRGLAVAVVILLSMLADVRTPGKLRRECEAHLARRR